ncbi:hypothetical protein SCLCIDRAFT_34335 [Scleroderma citrinum Foug A]|uniref:Uncharacterized protein n=1 Tax=Scleroderma citrinum Foug A TaxID=1036808 RepID=A0A0C2YKU4_9AGAM|nr:hypothetical protein SCLCIDRAFT_34335 [Scleroderma citrinum Foug A]
MSPVPEHAFDAHQGDDPFSHEPEATRVEYIDPGMKLYHNYHPCLNARKCDEHGQFLPDDALPLPHAQKASDNWMPYHNQVEFELADLLFRHLEIPAKKLMQYLISGL